jgi:hypothetical protein
VAEDNSGMTPNNCDIEVGPAQNIVDFGPKMLYFQADFLYNFHLENTFGSDENSDLIPRPFSMR